MRRKEEIKYKKTYQWLRQDMERLPIPYGVERSLNILAKRVTQGGYFKSIVWFIQHYIYGYNFGEIKKINKDQWSLDFMKARVCVMVRRIKNIYYHDVKGQLERD